MQIKTYGVSPITDDHDDLWGVPSLNELGFDTGKIRLQYLTEMYSSNEWEQIFLMKIIVLLLLAHPDLKSQRQLCDITIFYNFEIEWLFILFFFLPFKNSLLKIM